MKVKFPKGRILALSDPAAGGYLGLAYSTHDFMTGERITAAPPGPYILFVENGYGRLAFFIAPGKLPAPLEITDP